MRVIVRFPFVDDFSERELELPRVPNIGEEVRADINFEDATTPAELGMWVVKNVITYILHGDDPHKMKNHTVVILERLDHGPMDENEITRYVSD